MPAWFCYYCLALLSERQGDLTLSDELLRMAVVAAWQDDAFAELKLGTSLAGF